jgi:beta-glucosidase
MKRKFWIGAAALFAGCTVASDMKEQIDEMKTWQTGVAMQKMGDVLSLSPMVDVCRTPSFNRQEQSYR